jgi:hypothetical protein
MGRPNSELGKPTPDERRIERVAAMEYPDVYPVTLVGDRGPARLRGVCTHSGLVTRLNTNRMSFWFSPWATA